MLIITLSCITIEANVDIILQHTFQSLNRKYTTSMKLQKLRQTYFITLVIIYPNFFGNEGITSIYSDSKAPPRLTISFLTHQ